MHPVVRFWLGVCSLVVSLAAVSYLFLSFLFPGPELIFETRLARLVVTFLALFGTGTLVWAAVLSDSAQSPSTASNRNR